MHQQVAPKLLQRFILMYLQIISLLEMNIWPDTSRHTADAHG